MINHFYDIFRHWSYTDGEHKNNILFLSDPHFGDQDMQCLRKNYIGDDALVKRINSKVGKYDTVVFLGDIGDLSFVKKIRGYKVLIMGNHDSGASNYLRKRTETFSTEDLSPEDAERYREIGIAMFDKRTAKEAFDAAKKIMGRYTKVDDNHLFDEVYEGPLFIGPKLVLSHEPIDFPFALNLHGHDHSRSEGKDDWLHLNLCVENIDYTPVSIKWIVENCHLNKIDSIHRATIDEATERKRRKNARTKAKQGS